MVYLVQQEELGLFEALLPGGEFVLFNILDHHIFCFYASAWIKTIFQ
jgi:hypothetical protein